MKLALLNVFENNKGMIPWGLLSIATYLRSRHPDTDVLVIDINWDNPLEEIRRYRPDVIGISSMSSNYSQAIYFAQEIKKNTRAPVIIGGVHISTLPSSLSAVFDFAVIGEGEETVCDLADLYRRKGVFSIDDLRAVCGLLWREQDRLFFTPPRRPIQELDTLAYPEIPARIAETFFSPRWIAWDGRRGIRGLMMASRGCPFKCAFCSTTHFWDKVRMYSPEKIADDIQLLIERYGVTHIEIWDDLFTINRERLLTLSDIFGSRGIAGKIACACSTRANLFDEDLCRILKGLGVKALNFGFESGNDRMLKYLKAGSVSMNDNIRAVKLARQYDFYISANFIFGSPTETPAEMRDTLDFMQFIVDSGCKASIWNYISTPLPATPMWEIARERGKVNDVSMDWGLLKLVSERPLLLDDSIDIKEFNKIFGKAQEYAYGLDARAACASGRIFRHPLKALKAVMRAPRKLFKAGLYCLGRLISS